MATMFHRAANKLPPGCQFVVGCVKKNLLSPSPAANSKIQVATLKATYGERYPYPEPYPYKERPFNSFRALFDKTAHRLNENSKIIAVEGNIGVGKADFAKRLSVGFDLHYVEPLPDDVCFTDNDYKFDIRSLSGMLPECAKPYDLAKFYNDPHPEKGYAAKLALSWYEKKFDYYCEAMKHVLSTGQGVVMPTTVYSDLVYMQALRKMGWITPQFMEYYKDYRAQSICELFKPHFTIYLDAPIDVIKKRIAKRKDPKEIGARNLTDKYLETIADVYKKQYLPFCRQYGAVVEIDWSEVANERDMNAIIEELQLVSLDAEDLDEKKFEDWNRNDDETYTRLRLFLDSKTSKGSLFAREQPSFTCPELEVDEEGMNAIRRILDDHPVFNFKPGWAPQLGHSVAFKV